MFQKLYSDKKTPTCIKLDEMFSLKYLICNPKTKFGTCLCLQTINTNSDYTATAQTLIPVKLTDNDMQKYYKKCNKL